MLTVSDRDSELYEIVFQTNHTADLKVTSYFSHSAVAKAAFKSEPRYDGEGIAVDAQGALYLCEESQRSIFKCASNQVERLAIDWSPVKKYFGRDPNASFEGIAIGGNHLYVANERDSARIIVVDLRQLKVIDSFFLDAEAFAFGGPHYSDLSFWEGKLFILDRNHRTILEVNPTTKKVISEYSFAQMELAENVAYRTAYPTGTMEGLAVDREFFWMVTDNNGFGRIKYPKDSRPTLFKCRRPLQGE